MSKLSSELTNLLPRASVRGLRREYFVRLTTIALGLATIALVVHGVLLIPAYLYTHAEVVREQQELSAMTASASTQEERDINARIAAVKADISYLSRLSTQPTASAAVRAILDVPHPNVKLTGFTFALPSTGTGSAQMTVSGTAANRDALRAYVASLGQQPYITKADLPISAYAKETNIEFTVTLTGTFQP
jgi:hypothetical protein